MRESRKHRILFTRQVLRYIQVQISSVIDGEIKAKKAWLCLVQGHAVSWWQNCGYRSCCREMIWGGEEGKASITFKNVY